MSMWLAVLLVGLGSYVLRAVPLLLGERVQLPADVDAALHHAAVGAMTALLVLGVMHTVDRPFSTDGLAAALALAVAGAVGLRGHAMPLVVLSGGATYALALAVVRVLLG